MLITAGPAVNIQVSGITVAQIDLAPHQCVQYSFSNPDSGDLYQWVLGIEESCQGADVIIFPL